MQKTKKDKDRTNVKSWNDHKHPSTTEAKLQ